MTPMVIVARRSGWQLKPSGKLSKFEDEEGYSSDELDDDDGDGKKGDADDDDDDEEEEEEGQGGDEEEPPVTEAELASESGLTGPGRSSHGILAQGVVGGGLAGDR